MEDSTQTFLVLQIKGPYHVVFANQLAKKGNDLIIRVKLRYVSMDPTHKD